MKQIALSILSLVIAAEAADSNSKQTYTFGAMADGYYSWNRNRPRGGLNQIRLFDVNANRFSLSAAQLSVERVSDPVGFHVELGAGRSYSLMHSTDPAPRLFQYLPQAYITWKPSRVQLDFGKFYTSAGAELFESPQNWNYSRSLLFCWASSSQWGGIAAAGRFQVSRKWFLSPRIDWLTDSHGFATGTPQRVWEGTLTAEFKARDNLSARWEYRRDSSNQAFFERGDGSSSRTQTTFLIGLTANITFRR